MTSGLGASASRITIELPTCSPFGTTMIAGLKYISLPEGPERTSSSSMVDVLVFLSMVTRRRVWTAPRSTVEPRSRLGRLAGRSAPTPAGEEQDRGSGWGLLCMNAIELALGPSQLEST